MIIIGIDLNDPVQRHDHTQYIGELYMKEAILTIHPGTSHPVTNIRNASNYPIDGIWCSLGLTALRGGYLNFKEGIPSDQRMLWVEFPLTELFGSTNNTTKNLIKLKASDPRDVKKYLSRSKKYLKNNNCL